MAEGVGFEPTLGFPLSLISSQVPSTTQPPFLRHSLRLFISHVHTLGASRFEGNFEAAPADEAKIKIRRTPN